MNLKLKRMDFSMYNGKKILIMGLGREGAISLRFFLDNCPKITLGIADKIEQDLLSSEIKEVIAKNPRIKVQLGPD